MKTLLTNLWFLLAGVMLAAQCGPPIGPGPEFPTCPAGTRPVVCRDIGVAECGAADSLDPVVGCRVEAEPGVWLRCVAHCD